MQADPILNSSSDAGPGLKYILLITQIPYTVRVPGKGKNGCILQPKPSNHELSQLYEYQVGYSTLTVPDADESLHGRDRPAFR